MAFSSHPKELATLMGSVERLRTCSSLAFICKIIGDVLSLYQIVWETFLNNNRNILVLERANAIAQVPKIVIKLLQNFWIS